MRPNGSWQRGRLLFLLVFLCWLVAGRARAEEPLPAKLRGITVDEKLGQQVDRSATFRDQQGRVVTLQHYLSGKEPVLLTLNYYRCKMLCSLQLNALITGLRGLEWTAGKNFRIVTVSIDHREEPTLAREKRASYLRSLGRGEVDWSFLTGSSENIRRLTDSVGFHYRYDADQDQYAHPATIIFLSPEGKVSRYLYGLEYASRDLKLALLEASEGRVGSTVDRLILSCFHYDATAGRYGPFALGIMRLGGVATLIILAIFLVVLFRRDIMRLKSPISERT
jgi:protein SCO1